MTVEAEVRIVEARAEHAPVVAWVTLTAFRAHLEKGFWDFMLEGEDEAGKLHYLEALATTEQLHWANYSPFIVAEVNGTPAAALWARSRMFISGPRFHSRYPDTPESKDIPVPRPPLTGSRRRVGPGSTG